MKKPAFHAISQINFTVQDVRETVKTWNDVYGVGPWDIVDFNEKMVPEPIHHGKPGKFTHRLSICNDMNIQLEVIAPLTGESTFSEYVDGSGPGLHHLMIALSDSYDGFRKDLAEERDVSEVLCGGLDALGIEFAYMDLSEDLGFRAEIMKIPPGAPGPGEPEDTWPPKNGPVQTAARKTTGIRQIGFVVDDLEQYVRIWNDVYGIGPWHGLTFDRAHGLHDVIVCGKPGDYAAKIAICNALNVQIELIQPLDQNSIYATFLNENGGPGLHHIAVDTADGYDAFLDFLTKERGLEIYQSGIDGAGGKFAYMDLRDEIGAIVEFYDMPTDFVPPAPEWVYPAAE